MDETYKQPYVEAKPNKADRFTNFLAQGLYAKPARTQVTLTPQLVSRLQKAVEDANKKVEGANTDIEQLIYFLAVDYCDELGV